MFYLPLFILLIVLIILSLILLILGGLRESKTYGRIVIYFWGFVFALYLIAQVMHFINSKTVLDKEDFYGTYIIDRNYFSGKQADWQYNHYRFEIKENDSVYFHVTNGSAITETYKGKISTKAPFKSARPVFKMALPSHHVLNSNPTIYRDSWDFMMVFKSPKFHNMYFRKGEWKEIDPQLSKVLN